MHSVSISKYFIHSIDCFKILHDYVLTEDGAYPQPPTQPNFFYPFQTYTSICYGHSELPREEKSKFECKEKKFSLLLKVCASFC